MLATLLLYIVLMMCADRIGEFAQSTRQLWLGTSAMMLAVTALLMSAYFLASKFNPMHHAREVDRALGYDDDSLVTYVDLRRRVKVGTNDVTVAVHLQESALERVSRIDADQVIDARPLAVVLKILGGTALFLLVLFFAFDRGHPIFKIVIAFAGSFGVHYGFERFLRVPLPNASIEFLRALGF